jgi:hypothetical protein
MLVSDLFTLGPSNNARKFKLLLARSFLLRDCGATWAFPSTSIRVSALTANRQGTTMAQAAIATDVHQAFDVHLDSLTQIALNFTLGFKHATNPTQFVFA